MGLGKQKKFSSSYRDRLFRLNDQQWSEIRSEIRKDLSKLNNYSTPNWRTDAPWQRPVVPAPPSPNTVPGSGSPLPNSPLTPVDPNQWRSGPFTTTRTTIVQDDSENEKLEELKEELKQLTETVEQLNEEITQLKDAQQEPAEPDRDDYPLFDLTKDQDEDEKGTYLAHGCCSNCQQEVILRIFLGQKMPDQETAVTCPRCLVEQAIVGRKFIGVEQSRQKTENQPVRDNLLYGDQD
jgi:hypothetical protein